MLPTKPEQQKIQQIVALTGPISTQLQYPAEEYLHTVAVKLSASPNASGDYFDQEIISLFNRSFLSNSHTDPVKSDQFISAAKQLCDIIYDTDELRMQHTKDIFTDMAWGLLLYVTDRRRMPPQTEGQKQREIAQRKAVANLIGELLDQKVLTGAEQGQTKLSTTQGGSVVSLGEFLSKFNVDPSTGGYQEFAELVARMRPRGKSAAKLR